MEVDRQVPGLREVGTGLESITQTMLLDERDWR